MLAAIELCAFFSVSINQNWQRLFTPIMENASDSDSPWIIQQIIDDIKTKLKKPDKDFITREVALQGLSHDTLVSLLLDSMVSAGLLHIKKGSYSIGKAKGSSNDKQYLPDSSSVENIEPYPWTEDYLEFKKFIHDELISLKASISKKSIPESNKPPNHPIDYARSFIRSMEDSIISLERQLEQKQAIINKLLETPKEDRKAFHVEEASNPKRANPQQQIENNTHNKKKADNGAIEISKVEDNKKKDKQRVSE